MRASCDPWRYQIAGGWRYTEPSFINCLSLCCARVCIRLGSVFIYGFPARMWVLSILFYAHISCFLYFCRLCHAFVNIFLMKLSRCSCHISLSKRPRTGLTTMYITGNAVKARSVDMINTHTQTHTNFPVLYGHTYSKSMDQPVTVANPARGQLNMVNGYFPVRVRA